MSDRTAIPWADATWSPILGCTKESVGCESCYAIRTAYRQEHAFKRQEYRGLTRKLPDGSLNWTGHVNLIGDRLQLPLRWKKPRRIFVDSQSDLFHPKVPDEFIIRVFDTIRDCPQHTFQILTKRPERMQSFCSRLRWDSRGEGRLWLEENVNAALLVRLLKWCWLGVSVENQATADERIPLLLQTPAAVRFVSAEPLLGPVDLEPWLPIHQARDGFRNAGTHGKHIDWCIVGGESAGPPGRRLVERCFFRDTHGDLVFPCCDGTGWAPKPEALEWVRSFRDQCASASVPFFFKQWGGPRPKSAGRALDGLEWSQFPQSRQEVAG